MVPFGAPLVAIDDIASLADMEVLLDRRRARLAESARLASELTAREPADFPPELRRDGAEIVAAEQRIFEARV
jgi:hypothetical protein